VAEITYTPCRQEHFALIAPREGQEKVIVQFLSDAFAPILASSVAISCWENHRCLGAAGIIDLTPTRAYAWSLLSAHSGPHMLIITRKVIQVLDTYKHKRVEMNVNCDFEAGHQWARLLGFKQEAERMRKCGYFGEDQALYARVF